MPRYEYRCRDCEHSFELTRPMVASSDPATCPFGHTDTVKLLSTVAALVDSGSSYRRPAPARVPMAGGGCCGGGCG